MACACQKSATKKQYVYVDKSGSEQIYPSEIQARAAVVRNGGGRVVARDAA